MFYIFNIWFCIVGMRQFILPNHTYANTQCWQWKCRSKYEILYVQIKLNYSLPKYNIASHRYVKHLSVCNTIHTQITIYSSPGPAVYMDSIYANCVAISGLVLKLNPTSIELTTGLFLPFTSPGSFYYPVYFLLVAFSDIICTSGLT